jgi:sugar phosphate isomerase/epimerase
MAKFVTEYGQQLYLSAEDGAIQANKDGATYWYIDGSFPEEYPEHWSDERIAALNKQVTELGVKPILHGNFKAPLASDVEDVRKAAVANVLKEVELASKLSAPLIIHGGAIVEPRLVLKAKKDALDQYVKSLQTIAAYAKEKNVIILLENLSNYLYYRPFHYIFTTPNEYRYVFEKITDTHVKFFFDVGHAAICEGDPVAVIEEFHERIWGMSFSNNDGVRDLHLGLDQGLISYQNVVNKLIECQWQGVIAFEVRGRDFSRNVRDLEALYKKAIEQDAA